MSGKRLFIFLLAGVLATIVPTAAFAGCHVQVVTAIAPTDPSGGSGLGPITPTNAAASGAIVNQEGRTERVSDVLVYDDNTIGTTNCFALNNIVRLTYNVTLTNPSSISAASNANFDVYDNAGLAGLTILASSTVGLAPGGTPQTVITGTVQQAGTASASATGILAPTGVGSAFRIKNLRVDATSIAATGTITATVSSNVATALPAPVITTVATAQKTINAGAGVTVPGVGSQSSGVTLSIPATFTFSEENAVAPLFPNAFRTAVAAGTTVFGDIATTPTSVIFDSGTTVPSGVSVTWPATLTTSAANGTAGLIFTLRSGGSCVGPAACFAIYDTTANNTTAAGTMTVTTAAAAVTGATGATPAVGVVVGSPSGFGTASLHASFGPGEASGGGNDDVNAAAIPRYIATTSAVAGTTRNIFNAGNWFTINAVRTTLLYPFVSNVGGFNTGISVVNTCNDTGAFNNAAPTCSQTGGLTFYFFPTGGTPFCLNTDTTAVPVAPACTSAGVGAFAGSRGLNASGQLAPGGSFATALNFLLAAAGKPNGAGTFDGYIIVVTQFNNAHGFSAQFAATGAVFSANNALIIGGGTRNGSLSGVVESLA